MRSDKYTCGSSIASVDRSGFTRAIGGYAIATLDGISGIEDHRV